MATLVPHQVTANMPEEGTACTQLTDMEDFGATRTLQPGVPIAVKRKRAPTARESQQQSQSLELTQSWVEILGPPPPTGATKVASASAQKSGHRACWGNEHGSGWFLRRSAAVA